MQQQVVFSNVTGQANPSDKAFVDSAKVVIIGIESLPMSSTVPSGLTAFVMMCLAMDGAIVLDKYIRG
jgi:hypothetical protein